MQCLDTDLDIELKALLESIYVKYKYDFRCYSKASVRRQVKLALLQFDCKTVEVLQDKILNEPSSFAQLLTFFTVSTSEMFRDPSYFIAIRKQVIPILLTHHSLKVWIAGCSTGEEAYSFAILLKEEGLFERSIIYATDINAYALEKAKLGVFKLDDIQKYTANYQKSGGKSSFSDYYTAGFDGVIFNRSLREKINFADHSLTTDTYFSETQLISCRNVLIYFESELQNRALGIFHDSLCPGGILGLGQVETIKYSKYADFFDPIIENDRIYQKNKKIISK